ncbi:MAG: tetratricopeptide repeat protein, partial [Opitutaceae bacterium]
MPVNAAARPFALTAFAVLFSAVPAFSQAFVQGTVRDFDGKFVVGAVVALDGIDSKSHTETKTDKKGHYITSVRPAAYSISVTVDGKLRYGTWVSTPDASTADVLADSEPVNGKLHDSAIPYLASATTSDPLDLKLIPPGQGPEMVVGVVPPGGGRAAAPSKADNKVSKEREAQLAAKKELNDSFAAGKAALENKQWDEAITRLMKASELGPDQPAVWAGLAQAYAGSAKATKGADAAPIYDKSFAAFDKVLAITPNDAASYDNYALALAADNRLDDAKVKMAKAIESNPSGAGEYHYNLGALLMNRNQTDGALDEFKKAIDADPNYADAYFYYGSTLVGKATTDPSTGKMIAPPGTVEALQKYVQLKPDGGNAESAKALIAALGGSVQTKYS